MADIRPFKGIRFDKEKVGDLSNVVTPPYDVISEEERLWFLGRHPQNIVRLILPKETEGDGLDKYELASMYLRQWIDTGILIREDEESFYICEQEFEVNGERKKRLGLTCLVNIEEYERRTILPHENTMAKPLDDRLNLLRAARTNFDSVFGLFTGMQVNKILSPCLMKDPDVSAVDYAGVKNSLWKVADPQIHAAIREALADEKILIADGHHRYAAALAYKREIREKENHLTGDLPSDFVMMTLVSLSDPGLVILPTHRLVCNISDFDKGVFMSQIAELFEVTESSPELLEKNIASAEGHVFGLYLGDGEAYVLKLRTTADPSRLIDTAASDALKRLDVSILHSLILEKLLGIDAARLTMQSHIRYIKNSSDALSAVDRKEGNMAFLMNPTRVEEVEAIAGAGERMPQKSTFFYPKLTTGMVLYVMP